MDSDLDYHIEMDNCCVADSAHNLIDHYHDSHYPLPGHWLNLDTQSLLPLGEDHPS